MVPSDGLTPPAAGRALRRIAGRLRQSYQSGKRMKELGGCVAGDTSVRQ